jgi:acetyl-CoA/propionyl-CoA carboxylase biotin carboxyl carrier protein
MLRALAEFEVTGVKTLLGFHRALLEHPCFVEGATCHGVVESQELAERAEQLSHEATVAAGPDGAGPARERRSVVEVDGRRFSVTFVVPEPAHAELARRRRERTRGGAVGGAADAIVSPMQGTVLAVEVAEGDEVEAGQVICVVEAMKMENEVRAHRAGTVTQLSVVAGEPIASGQVICVVGDAS